MFQEVTSRDDDDTFIFIRLFGILGPAPANATIEELEHHVVRLNVLRGAEALPADYLALISASLEDARARLRLANH